MEVPDIEDQPLRYIALALVHLRNEIAKLPQMIEDNSRPVDEYRPQSLASDAETQIFLQPQWEVTERIESIFIAGPASNVTLQLGDRVWNIAIPAVGFVLIAPIAIYLERSDPRVLTANTAGDYVLELMGHCDTRGNLI